MTEVFHVHDLPPDRDAIQRAAETLRRGGLVAFPTETVYGLGANALDPAAVERIFAAKGRPANNPLIVHVARSPKPVALAAAWPAEADRLAERFWPGPLTLVLAEAADRARSRHGGGRDGGRSASRPIPWPARSWRQPLIADRGPQRKPLERNFPDHCLACAEEPGGQIDVVLDGGPTSGGLESTVLDLIANPPRLLRPGLSRRPRSSRRSARSPARPRRRVDATQPLPRRANSRGIMRPRPDGMHRGAGRQRVEELANEGLRVGWLTAFDAAATPIAGATIVTMPATPVELRRPIVCGLARS